MNKTCNVRAIYIGKYFCKDFGKPIYIHGSNIVLDRSELFYGMLGNVWYSDDDKKWDFRPDGLNIQHLVNKKDLYFPEE